MNNKIEFDQIFQEALDLYPNSSGGIRQREAYYKKLQGFNIDNVRWAFDVCTPGLTRKDGKQYGSDKKYAFFPSLYDIVHAMENKAKAEKAYTKLKGIFCKYDNNCSFAINNKYAMKAVIDMGGVKAFQVKNKNEFLVYYCRALESDVDSINQIKCIRQKQGLGYTMCNLTEKTPLIININPDGENEAYRLPPATKKLEYKNRSVK